MALDILAWHDRTTPDHQTQMNNARAAGYSTLSMCLYGAANDPRYAVSMVKRATQTAEQMFLGMTFAGFQTKFDQMAAQGWGPLLVTATGPTNSAVFSAIFIHQPPPLTRHGLTEADLRTMNAAQMTAGNILRWADAYGDAGNQRYIAIWVPNTENRAWNCDSTNDASATMQQRFDALVTGGARPVVVATTPELKNLIAYDDSTQQQWQLWDGMTSADYQTKFNTLYPQGLRPIRVSAKGTGSNARFGVLFSVKEDADSPTFRVNGPSGSAAVAAIDQAMHDMMTKNFLHGASLAVVVGTRLVYARGYTIGSSSYPDVQPTTFFRQASVSKSFVAAAIYQMIDEKLGLPGGGTFTLNTLLKDVLPGLANGPVMATWNQVTMRHLLEMTSGITSNVMGEDLSVATVLAGIPVLPVSTLQVGQWLYRQKIVTTPGDPKQAIYSNAGYMLLGMVVAALRGAPDFVTAIQNTLLKKLQITRVRSAVTVASKQAGDEARYHPRPLTTTSSMMVTGQPLCLWGYGENNLENCEGGGGLSAAATDVARLVAALSVTTNNPMMSTATLRTWLQNAATATSTLTGPDPNEAHGYHGFDSVAVVDATNHIFSGEKGGLLDTSQNGFQFVTGGVSTVLCWNGQTPVDNSWFPIYKTLTDAIGAQSWGSIDLFPTFGMDVFQVVKPPPIKLPPSPPPRATPAHMIPPKGPVKQA
jgi:CubicO group peptidase (beta-lactamase class C family)